MCGILGTLRARATLAPDDFARMLDTLAARGPDGNAIETFDDGRVMLGHRRLAIIDLSAAGRQPMRNEDGTLWLTFNGEIYNYRELRRQLVAAGHRFASACDAEVIVHGYEEWGVDVLRRLSGIFAFGLWHCERRELLLARDPLGVKPLYYAACGGDLSFASQPKAIVTDPAYTRALDPAALRDFLAYGYVPHARAIFRGMHKLPAAHYALVRADDPTVEPRRYWQPPAADPTVAVADWPWRLRDALVTATRAQLVADVPLGCFLSGGIDSSLLLALARPHAEELRSFTIGFTAAASDEREYARAIASHFSTRHHEEVMDTRDLRARLCALPEHFDEPFDPNGPLPFMEVARLARRHDTIVALGGDGGDELFAGYRRYDDFDCPAGWNGGLRRRAWRALRAAGLRGRGWTADDRARFFAYEGCLDDDDQRLLLQAPFLADVSDHALDALCRFERPDLPALDAARWFDFHLYLVDHVLTKVDRAAMAHGVEARVPLLDLSVVELAWRIPSALHYARGERKALLKRVAQQVLPDATVSTRKKGFSSPLAAWADADFARWRDAALAGGTLRAHEVLAPDWRAGLARIAHAAPARAARAEWLLLAAELWARRWLESPPRAAA